MPRFRIKATARADLKGIAIFTEQTWGREQRNSYLTELDQAFHRLDDNSEIGESCDHIRSGYRVFPVGSLSLTALMEPPMIALMEPLFHAVLRLRTG